MPYQSLQNENQQKFLHLGEPTVWNFVIETLRKPLEMWPTKPLFDR